MPKMKTNKSVKARFKVSKNKKLKRNSPGKSHLLAKKTSKRKRRLKKSKFTSDAHKKRYLKVMAM